MSELYPESLLPVVTDLPEQWTRFAELCEEMLVGYGYNTARVYWGDQQHLAE